MAVYTAKFDPYSFNELIKPAMLATQQYRTMEEQYSNLAESANQIGTLLNKDLDRESLAKYDAYNEELRKATESLSNTGNIDSRALLNLRRKFAGEITPIKSAFASRAAQIAEQRKGMAQGLYYDYDARTTSLDRFIENPSLAPQVANIPQMLKEAGTQVMSIAKGMIEDSDFNKISGYGQLLKNIVTKGLTAENAQAIKRAIISNPDDPEISKFKTIIDNTMNAHGVNRETWGEQDYSNIYNKVLDAVDFGVLGADIQYRANRAYMTPAQRLAAIRKANKGSKKIEGIDTGFGSTMPMAVVNNPTEDIKFMKDLKLSKETPKKIYNGPQSYFTGTEKYVVTDTKNARDINNAKNELAKTYKHFGESFGWSPELTEQKLVNMYVANSKKQINVYDMIFDAVDIKGTKVDDILLRSFNYPQKDSGLYKIENGKINLEPISSEDARDILEEPIKENRLAKGMTKEHGMVIATPDGKVYSYQGSSEMRKFNNDVKVTNEFLDSFGDTKYEGNPSKGTTKIINMDNIRNIRELEQWLNTVKTIKGKSYLGLNILEGAAQEQKKSYYLPNGATGMTINLNNEDPAKKDIVKIVIIGTGGGGARYALTSMNDITSGSLVRDRTTKQYIKRGYGDLKTIFKVK